MGKMIDLTGQRFGRLTVIERAKNYVSPNGRQAARWICLCDCGNKTTVVGGDLRTGRTRSCGCFEQESRYFSRNLVHGGFGTKLYNVWCGMKKRCYNSKNKFFKDYGGRGITVCDEWRDDFAKFRDWAMANGYREGLSIDRIDNDKGYSPDNCRWTTREEQGNNKRSNRTFLVNGEKRTLAQLCREYQKNRSTVEDRLNRGWTIEEALDLVPRKK